MSKLDEDDYLSTIQSVNLYTGVYLARLQRDGPSSHGKPSRLEQLPYHEVARRLANQVCTVTVKSTSLGQDYELI